MCTCVAPVLLFALFLTPLQDPVPTDAPDSLSVLKASWQKLSFRPGWDEAQDPASNVGLQELRTNTSRDANGNPTSTSAQLPSTGTPAIRPNERIEQRKNTRATAVDEGYGDAAAPGQRVEQYVYQIKVLNGGSKTIEAIDWDYSFSSGDTEAAHHRFQTLRRIKPSTGATLTAKSFVPPSRVINARSGHAIDLSTRIIIGCILYSDGTASWRAGGSDADCQLLRNRARAR